MPTYELEISCPVCGHDDVDAGEREGTQLIGCQRCGWPNTQQEISIGQAVEEAEEAAYQRRAADVGCGCGLDGRSCDDSCDCACHWVAVH